jgi:TPP-dependent pyruvate/acetoin dehydrogenase alpha subunit
MPSKKKMKLKRSEKEKYRLWTNEEKLIEILKIKKHLISLGLGVYEKEMKRFSDICQAYIKESIEYCDKIKFPESKRVLVFIFKNSSKHKISSQLLFDENV